MEQKNCEHCGKKLGDGNKKRRFCDDSCRNKHNSKKRYEKLKDNPEYKAMKKRYFDKWLVNNREVFNEKMREVSKRWQTKHREELKKKQEAKK